MGQITWNTDVNAPGCPGEIVNEDGRTILVQTDWDYPGVASTFGWSIRDVQKPLAARTLESAQTDLDGIDTVDELTALVSQCWDEEEDNPCEHDRTDGTVDCECGVTTSEFIVSAQQWLDDNDGAVVDDPGYFD
jgi:hypothetical protein